jgi:hypothetical protein
MRFSGRRREEEESTTEHTEEEKRVGPLGLLTFFFLFSVCSVFSVVISSCSSLRRGWSMLAQRSGANTTKHGKIMIFVIPFAGADVYTLGKEEGMRCE